MKKIILAGNPNCGKTTLFNTLTKSRQATGNRLGVTVRISKGIYKSPTGEKCEILDLPGTYSISGFTSEEKEVSDFLAKGEFDCIICVINTLNPVRSLKLLFELKALGKPLLGALNFCDITEKNGITANTGMLEKEIGVKFIKISAAKGENLDRLISEAEEAAVPPVTVTSDTLKSAEEICKRAFTTGNKKTKIKFNPDKAVLNKYAAFPIMLGITAAVFALTFSNITGSASDFINGLLTVRLSGALKDFLPTVGVNPLLISLVCDGIISPVGSVLSFLPQIGMLTLLTALLEDSGFLSRCAYICDKPLRKLGLQGKCFFCLMMGFGCTVPAVFSTRILETGRDKIKTLLLLPFIPCSAKMPLILLMFSLFSKNAVRAVILIYGISVFFGIVYMLILKIKDGKREKGLFILELPRYSLPGAKSVRYALISRLSEFLLKSGTVILICSIIMWLLSHFTPSLKFTEGAGSITALIGQKALFIFSPLGLSDGGQVVSLISGIFAREAIVSSLKIMYNGSGTALADAFTGASALAFCTFSVLFSPCIGSLAAIRKEIADNRIFFAALLLQSIAAYLISAAVFNIGRLFI